MNLRATAGPVIAICDCQRATMSLDNLQRQNQADTHAPGLGRVERNKKIGGIGEAGSVVFHKNDGAVGLQPANHTYPHGRFVFMRLRRCIHCIANQVDEGLFQLGRIGVNSIDCSRHRDRLLRAFPGDKYVPAKGRRQIKI